jgi:hypothetical protein
MSPSNAATFTTDTYDPPGFGTAEFLLRTGDPCGTCTVTVTPDESELTGCILFVFAEKWNAKSVAALLPVPSNKANCWQTSEV